MKWSAMKLWQLLLAFLLASSVFAQERVPSLQQYELGLESKIRRNLEHYLQPKDYVLRVSALGSPYVAQEISPTTQVAQPVESLPGFSADPPETPVVQQIPKSNTPTLWEVSRVQIDLIMHKEISSSLQEYLLRSVPLIAGLIPERGDAFNFLPITPNEVIKLEPEEEAPVEPLENLEEEPLVEPLTWYEQLHQQYGIWTWVALGVVVFLFLLLLILLFRRPKKMVEQPVQQATPDLKQQFEQEKQEVEKERTKKMQDFFAQEEQTKLVQEIVKELIGHEDWKTELVHEWSKGRKDKLPLLICALGTFTSRSLFAKVLGSSVYGKLERTANDLSPQDSEIADILKESYDFIKAKSIDTPQKYQNDPFRFLDELSPSQVSFLVKDEPIRIKAIVLSRLNSEGVSQILKKMPPDEQSQVLITIGNLHELPLDLIEGVAMELTSKLPDLPDENTASFDGVDMLADLITFADNQTRRDILKQLKLNDQKLSLKVEERSFVFESIPLIPKEVLTEAVRRMNSDDVLTAFVGADREIQKAVILCFNETVRGNMVSQLKAKSPTAGEIDDKKRLFVAQIRQLADEGKIALKDLYLNWQKRSRKARVA